MLEDNFLIETMDWKQESTKHWTRGGKGLGMTIQATASHYT